MVTRILEKLRRGKKAPMGRLGVFEPGETPQFQFRPPVKAQGGLLGVSKQLVTNEQISRIVLDWLREGRSVEIDGLGVFTPNDDGEFRFEPRNGLRVFLAYVEEDAAQVMAQHKFRKFEEPF